MKRLAVKNTFPYGRQRMGRTKTNADKTNAIRGRVRRAPR